MHQPEIHPSMVTTRPPLEPKLVLEKLHQEHPSISFVQLQWQDYAGVLRAKVVVIEVLLAQVAGGKLPHAPAIAYHCAVDSTLLPGIDTTTVHWLVPDWSSLRLSPRPGTVTVMCGVVGANPSCPNPNGDLCPRQALVRVVREAAQTWELVDFLVGFEVEFQVMKLSDRDGEGMVPHSWGLGHNAASSFLDPCWSYVEECVQQLRALEVHVQDIHSEGLRGQYEIALGPLPPLEAVDQLVLVHSVLKHTFARHGCMVTMSPQPVAAAPQQMNGQHMHLSIRAACPEQEEFFLAGILKRLPSLWSFFLPQKVSYERTAPFMAGNFVGWGTENRTVPIRKIKSGHWEVRSIDATANMYLTLAAVLSAGLLGLAGREPLNWPDLSTGDWPHLSLEEIHAQVDLLPSSLGESLSVLGAHFGGLDTMLSRRMLQHYVELKRYELSQMEEMGSEKARNLLVEVF